jgi:hypothetical protein
LNFLGKWVQSSQKEFEHKKLFEKSNLIGIRAETFSYDSEGNESSTVSYSVKAKIQSPSLEEMEKISSE